MTSRVRFVFDDDQRLSMVRATLAAARATTSARGQLYPEMPNAVSAFGRRVLRLGGSLLVDRPSQGLKEVDADQFGRIGEGLDAAAPWPGPASR